MPSTQAKKPTVHFVVTLAYMVTLAGAIAQVQKPTSPISELKKLSVEELMDIVVTSVSRRPEKLLDAASAIQVITGEDIRRSGATRLPEALRLAGNLDVAQKNSHDWGISARGFNTELANKLLVMIDGRTVYTPLFSGVIWNVQDYLLEDIERIEVISGPGSSLWGANAVNGVINIISKSAHDTQGAYLESGGGSSLQGFAGLRYGGKLAPNVSFRLYAKHFDRDNEVLASGTDATDAWHKTQGGFRIDAGLSPQNTLTLQGDYYTGHDQLQSGGRDTIKGGNILGRWEHVFSNEAGLSVQLYYDRTYMSQPVPALVINSLTLAPAGNFTDDLDTYDVDVQHRLLVGAQHHIVWGLGYRFTSDTVGNAPALAFFPPELDQKLFSAFFQDEVALRENLSVALGTKVEHFDYTGIEFEPSVRLQWNPVPNRTFWAAVSRAVRTPSRIDRHLSQGAPPYFVLLTGAADYDSEILQAYELGWRALLGSKADASLSVFYHDYDKVRSTVLSPATVFPLFFQNGLEGETYGFEFSSNVQPLNGWRLYASYALLREHLRIKPGQTDFNNTLNETSDPEHRLSLRSAIDLPGDVEFDTLLRWISARPGHSGPTPGSLPSYWEMDVRLGWQPSPGVELSLVGQNLLHNQHAEYGFPSPSGGAIQRSIYGKILWRF